MRRGWYTFSSELTPGQVEDRLLALCRPMRFGWGCEEHRLFYKRLRSGQFYLLKTGGMLQVRPQLPFVGSVTNGETGGSVITGGFFPSVGLRRALAGMAALALCFALLGARGHPENLIVLAPFCVLWCLYGWALFTKLPRLLAKRQEAETLAFIEENLLR